MDSNGNNEENNKASTSTFITNHIPPPQYLDQNKPILPQLKVIFPEAGILRFPAFSNEYKFDRTELTELKHLGKGASGVVKLYHYVPTPSRQEIAMKTINLSMNDQKSIHEIKELKEIIIFKQLPQSQYIVDFYGFAFDEALESLFICMEPMDLSLKELYKKMHEKNQFFPEKLLGYIAVSIINGLQACKEKEIMHRDLKPYNILINLNGDIKLCDFGVAQILEASQASSFVGTWQYWPTERFDTPKNNQVAKYDIRADVWSLGITLCEAALGENPYIKSALEQFDQSTFNYQQFPILKDQIINTKVDIIIERCLNRYSDKLKGFVKNCLSSLEERPRNYDLLITSAFCHDFSSFIKENVADEIKRYNIDVSPTNREDKSTNNLMGFAVAGIISLIYYSSCIFVTTMFKPCDRQQVNNNLLWDSIFGIISLLSYLLISLKLYSNAFNLLLNRISTCCVSFNCLNKLINGIGLFFAYVLLPIIIQFDLGINASDIIYIINAYIEWFYGVEKSPFACRIMWLIFIMFLFKSLFYILYFMHFLREFRHKYGVSKKEKFYMIFFFIRIPLFFVPTFLIGLCGYTKIFGLNCHYFISIILLIIGIIPILFNYFIIVFYLNRKSCVCINNSAKFVFLMANASLTIILAIIIISNIYQLPYLVPPTQKTTDTMNFFYDFTLRHYTNPPEQECQKLIRRTNIISILFLICNIVYTLSSIYKEYIFSVSITNMDLGCINFIKTLVNYIIVFIYFCIAIIHFPFPQADYPNYQLLPIYQPLIPVNLSPTIVSSEKFTTVKTNDSIFSFSIQRQSSGAKIWDTSIGGLLFVDKYLQIAAYLSTNRIYGFRETVHTTLKHDMTDYHSYGMWARDHETAMLNLYG